MNHQLHILQHLAACLEQANIPYMVSGSMAMNYYAQPRMTRDIDIILELQTEDVPRLAQSLGEDYYFDEDTAQAAILHHSLFNILHHASMVKIDCIVRKPALYRREEFSHRQYVKIDGFHCWVVAAEDLLLSKLDWLKDSRSEMQFNDVRNLINAVAELDWDYMTRWAAELGISALLQEVKPW